MSKLLRITEYDSNWELEFNKLKEHLDNLLLNLHLEIIHVGSTSVKGMSAKPIIDLDIVFNENFESIKKILTSNNYLYQGDLGIEDRYAFKYLKDDFHEHHLYVIKEGKDSLLNHLKLKKALQNSKSARLRYSNFKKELIQRNNVDRDLYTNSKTELIKQIIMEDIIMKSIVFAGGCFWGVEAYFKQLEGVTDTEVGYINGEGKASYEEVCNASGHAEAVYIRFDEDVISFKKLLDHLFNIINPTSINKQGNDKGIQYRTGIYNYTAEMLGFINSYITLRQKEYLRPIVIELKTNLEFFSAEENHQDYLKKNQHGYCHVDLGSYKNIK